MENTTIRVNDGTEQRDYIDGEKDQAGAIGGYAHLEPSDVIDASENMADFFYHCTHLPTGKTWMKRIACLDKFDFRNYLALWNTIQPSDWRYKALSDHE